MSRLHRSLAALGLVVACGDAEPSRPEAVAWFTSPTGIALEAARTQAVDLRWRPPTCPQVYRVTIDEDVPERHQRLTNTPPERSQSFLVLGPDHLHPQQVAARPGEDDLWQGLQVFFGPRTKDRTLRRELHLSGALLGPASPDAACFERTWDPMEDALALGWPRLPARLVARGETWTGARVESRCNKAACIDPQSGAGGADAHQLPCVTMSWREHLEVIRRNTDTCKRGHLRARGRALRRDLQLLERRQPARRRHLRRANRPDRQPRRPPGRRRGGDPPRIPQDHPKRPDRGRRRLPGRHGGERLAAAGRRRRRALAGERPRRVGAADG